MCRLMFGRLKTERFRKSDLTNPWWFGFWLPFFRDSPKSVFWNRAWCAENVFQLHQKTQIPVVTYVLYHFLEPRIRWWLTKKNMFFWQKWLKKWKNQNQPVALGLMPHPIFLVFFVKIRVRSPATRNRWWLACFLPLQKWKNKDNQQGLLDFWKNAIRCQNSQIGGV